MNIKLHTPNSMKKGSGMSSMKQFLLALLATTISIALTFGTAAIVDYNKKQNEKREIVMMVMYDMYNSLKPIEKADSMIRQLMDIQEKIAADTSLYTFEKKIQMYTMLPKIEFTETAENIFSSSIETINTVGNVLFTENVAKFYQLRKMYKATICDSIGNEIRENFVFNTLDNATNVSFFEYALMSCDYKYEMHHLFSQCKQMMKVTDKELDAYRKERAQMENNQSEKDNYLDSVTNVLIEQQKRINESRDKWKKE